MCGVGKEGGEGGGERDEGVGMEEERREERERKRRGSRRGSRRGKRREGGCVYACTREGKVDVDMNCGRTFVHLELHVKLSTTQVSH